MTPLVLTDLDDTLFSSLRKQPAQDGLVRATTATNGHHSFMSKRQKAFFDWLAQTTEIVPVTARSTGAYDRVHLQFEGPAVLAMGAVIRLTEEQVDPAWQRRIERIAEDNAKALSDLRSTIPDAFESSDYRHWIVEEYGAPIYLCVKSNASEPSDIARALGAASRALAPVAATKGIRIAVNGNNLSAIPTGISKEAAVKYLLETHYAGTERPVLGIGDSLSDLGFMSLCSMAVMPVPSQAYAAIGASVPTVRDEIA